jgi:SAM-dependent methyltransferase
VVSFQRLRRAAMAKTDPFDVHTDDYERWFAEHAEFYDAELAAVDSLLPRERAGGLEVGVGTGKFAAPLGIPMGLEPSQAMADRAAALGIDVRSGIAEELPYPDSFFSYVLMVVTLCFVDDPLKAFREAFRVLKPGGFFINGFVDRESEIGRRYCARKETSVFYRDARFYSVAEVLDLLAQAGFRDTVLKQTLLPGTSAPIVKDGYGEGSFIVIRAAVPQP